MPKFELYDRRDTAPDRGETVTVMRGRLLSFSPGAYTRLGSPRAVRYLVSKDERLIGFEPCEPGEAHAHAVSAGTRIMSAVALLKDLGADPRQTRRYDLHVQDGLPPYIDLKEPGIPVTGNRRKARQDG